MDRDPDTRSRILGATVELLLKNDRSLLTTRRIAQEAQVNIAAINYHFGSKEELIEKAVEAATASAFEKGLATLFAPDRVAVERLRGFLNGYARGLVSFPGLTTTAFLTLLANESSASFFGGYLTKMLERVGQVIAEVQGDAAPTDSASAALMTLSCVIFPFLVSNTLREAGTIDYSNDSARMRYIDTALAIVLGVKKGETENE